MLTVDLVTIMDMFTVTNIMGNVILVVYQVTMAILVTIHVMKIVTIVTVIRQQVLVQMVVNSNFMVIIVIRVVQRTVINQAVIVSVDYVHENVILVSLVIIVKCHVVMDVRETNVTKFMEDVLTSIAMMVTMETNAMSIVV